MQRNVAILMFNVVFLSLLDLDADPQGLHCLSALKWLETLLQKCTHAFSVQLDGSLCTHSPCNNHDNSQDEDAPDLAGKLVSVCLCIFGIDVTWQFLINVTYIRETTDAFFIVVTNYVYFFL